MSSVEVEMRVTEVDESDASDEKHQPGDVSLTLGIERIVTDLITVGEIVDVVLFLKGMGTTVDGERMSVTKQVRVES